jgi:hypothetical protein
VKSPTPQEIKAAILDWIPSERVEFRSGWKTRGRPWTYGIRGVVEHHLSGTGDGAVDWCQQVGTSDYPYCNNVTRRDGRIVVMSALSAWGSGAGGPWPAAGVPQDRGHEYLWQNEHESWGTKQDFTDEMWESSTLLNCALRQVAEVQAFPNFRRLVNHASWTNGGRDLGLTYNFATYGRKNDTLYPVSEFRRRANAAWKTRQG